jgi:MtaA/CmuA family methyltransferase
MSAAMTPRERVLAVLHGREADRVPVINPTSVATVESMNATGAYFPHAHVSAEKMAALAGVGYEVLGFDSVAPYFSVQHEAAALGCTIDWGKRDEMPTTVVSPIDEPDQIKIPANFLDLRPVKTILGAIRLLRAKYGQNVAIIGKVIGPWTLTYHLHGVNRFLLETVLEPDKVRSFLEILKQVPVMFAEAQFEAGADAVTWADHATADLISSKGYQEFLLPVHRYSTARLKTAGPLILHLCGSVEDRLPALASAGFDAFHIDSRNDLGAAVRQAAGRMLLVGNINNPNTLLNGSLEDVRRAVNSAVDSGVHMVAPECAVPCWTPNRNLAEIVKTVRLRGHHVGRGRHKGERDDANWNSGS